MKAKDSWSYRLKTTNLTTAKDLKDFCAVLRVHEVTVADI